MGKRLLSFLVICLCAVSMAFAQQKVTGVVIESETGEPVIGASVLVKGAQAGAATDINGKFTISNVPNSATTLTVSYIGMKAKEVAIKPGTMKIFLENDSKTLQEQFVVAYGTATKETFTGAASVIDGAVIENRQVSNISNALAGNVAGVTALSSNGQPGTGSTIRVRGFGSINAGMSPLYVVDGLPYDGDLSAINTADIESMTVLKDAAASALYGARAANGVILITTKKGSRGEDAKITFDAKWGSNSRQISKYDVISSSDKYMETLYSALNNAGRYNLGYDAVKAHNYANNNIFKSVGLQMYTLPEGEGLIGTNGLINPNAKLGYSDGEYFYTPDNWEDNVYENGLRQEYNLSISGGNEKTTYYISAAYLNDEGIIKGSGLERLATRASVDYQAKDWLKIGTNIAFTNATNKYPDEQTTENSSGNAFRMANYIAPIYPMFARNADGSYKYGTEGNRIYDYGDGTTGNYTRNWMAISNPIGDLLYQNMQYQMDILNTKWYARLQPIKDLTISATYGLNLDNTRYNMASSTKYGQSASYGGEAMQEHIRTAGVTQQYMANYKKQFGMNGLDILAGYESYYWNEEWSEAYGQNLYKEGDYTVNNSIDQRRGYGARTEYSNRRFIARANYDYDERIFGYVSYTREGSSRFAPGKKWGGFFSVSAAWNLAKENWFSDCDWMDLLKVRASFGQNGNDNIGNYYAYLDQFSMTGANGVFSDGSLDYKGNPDLTWEKSNAFDIAVDFDFWKGKLSGSIDYYSRQTSDMLYNKPVAGSLGYTSIPMNIGSMRNSGIEIELFSKLINTNTLSWDLNYNITFNKNKIIELAPELEGELIDGSRIYREGESMYNLYMVKYAGVDPTTGLALYWAKKDVLSKTEQAVDDAGKPMVDDNGDPIMKKIGEEEYATSDWSVARSTNRQATGDLTPTATGGFGTTLTFYGIDLSVQCAYQFGGKVWDYAYQDLMHAGSSSDAGQNWHNDIANAWTPSNINTVVPRLNTQDEYTNASSDRWLVSSNYLAINNITLGYSFPKSLLRNIGIEGLRIYGSADNLALFSARKGLDPRMGMVSATSATYSALRSMSLGLKVTF